VACRSDVGLFVAAMLQRPPQGLNGLRVIAMSGQLNFEQACSILSKVTGKQIHYSQVEHGVMANYDKIVGAHMVSLNVKFPSAEDILTSL
jgi:hypothetical protein